MGKIDRLGWAAGIAFVSHGAHLGIRVTDPAVIERLPDHLPPGWKPSSSPVVDGLYSLIVGGSEPGAKVRRYNLLYSGPARLARTMDLDEVFEELEGDLHFQVAVHARRRLFVHAGVVGWRGRAIVIPGRSMSGKTSLVATLVKAGATYYSDEFAVFDVQGRVHPYSRPLGIREEGTQRSTKYAVEALGGRAGTRPLPVGLIILTEYRPQARWHPQTLSPGQAVLALLHNTVLARSKSDFALQTLRRGVPEALTLKGKRGEAHDVIPSLMKYLEG